jgi:hypothetical protein
MPRRTLLALAALLVSGPAATADIVPPGHKWVRSSARFENLADFPDHVFFVAHHPDHDFSRGPDQKKGVFDVVAERLDPARAEVGLGGNPIMGGKYLLAVPKSLAGDRTNAIPVEWFNGRTPGVLQAAIPGGYRTMPETEKRDEFWFVYKVRLPAGTSEKKEDALRLELTQEDKPSGGAATKDGESPSSPPEKGSSRWYVAGGIAAVALFLLAGWFWRRRH